MATSIDMFAYLAAFVSIILALAVSDLVQSLHRLLRAPTPGEMESHGLNCRFDGLRTGQCENRRSIDFRESGDASSVLTSLGRLPDGEFAPGRIDEVKSTASRKREDRLGDRAACLRHRIECRFEIVHADHWERRRKRFGGLSIQADIHIACRRGCIIGAIIRERPTKGLGVEAPRQLVRGDAWELDIIDEGACHFSTCGSVRRVVPVCGPGFRHTAALRSGSSPDRDGSFDPRDDRF